MNGDPPAIIRRRIQRNIRRGGKTGIDSINMGIAEGSRSSPKSHIGKTLVSMDHGVLLLLGG